jgi:hypothetical protein
MSVNDILQQIDSEIQRLQQARRILGGQGTPGVRAAGASSNGVHRRGPRKMSQEARDRIAAAQRARWAKVRAGKKK